MSIVHPAKNNCFYIYDSSKLLINIVLPSLHTYNVEDLTILYDVLNMIDIYDFFLFLIENIVWLFLGFVCPLEKVVKKVKKTTTKIVSSAPVH